MDITAILNLSMAALAQVLNLIAEIKGQGGLSDDQIAAAAKTAAAGNDTLYAQIMTTLNAPPTP